QPLPFAVSESNSEEHPSLLCLYNLDAPTRYPHLIDHSDNAGFYLPCDFNSPLRCLEFLDGEATEEGSRTEKIQALEKKLRKIMGDKAGELIRSLTEGDGSEEKSRKQIESLRRETSFAPKKPEPPPKAPRGKH